VAVASGLGAVAIVFAFQAFEPKAKVLTQADVDAAVAYTMKRKPQPSVASVAAEAIRPSVVRVTGYDPSLPASAHRNTGVASQPGAMPEDAVLVGSGVVIDDRGTILTNYHVAGAAEELKVTFANGLTSIADLVGAQPEDDLAVIRPRELPDDLKPATMVSTGGLRPGDEVVAVGFPFGIGPSVSAGVISGLRREWVFSDKRRARNLIQFDAAANPGNSGGPLVNLNGEVVGIVTGIVNPTRQSVFIGIGFAVPIENAARAVGRSPF
jgi:S1-C subfamily serine protease